MPWYAAAASVTGSAHARAGQSCQDYCAFRLVDGMLLGALSDGAGSAKSAHDGALFAVEKALQQLSNRTWNELPEKDEFWRFSATFHVGIRDELAARAKEKELDLADLACTLLAFVATPEWVAAIHVGDSLLVLRAPNEKFELLFKPDRGEYVNETTFVTSSDSFERLQVAIWPKTPAFLCAASDGVERVAIRFKDWTPHQPFFETLDDYMESRPGTQQGAKDVAEFLSRAKLRAKTDDDTSLLLGAYLV
jgi:hypothetical protein